MANSRDPSRSDNDDTPPQPSEPTPLSSPLVSPLALARELAARLERQQNSQGEAWRLACALSLSIVDLLESTKASDASDADADTDDNTVVSALDPLTR